MRDGTVVEANGAAVALLGTPPTAFDGLHDADRTALLGHLDALAQTGSAPPGPILVRLGVVPDVRFLDLHLGPHPAGGALVLAHDVTERERLDAVIAEFATGVYLTDADLRATWIPRRVSESVGLPRERFVDSDVYDLVHPDDVAPTRDLVARARQVPGVRCSRPLRVRQLDQPDVWWPIVTHLIWRGDDPAMGGLLVRFDMDLAAGVHVRGAEETAQTLVTLGPSSPTGALHLDLDGTLLQRSTRVREILRPLADDADQRWLDLLREEDRPAIHERLAAARSGDLLTPAEVAFEGPDAVVWARVEVLPYRDAHGNVAGMFANVTDLTAEHEARAALAAAREELWHLANHDALTGLANRYLLAERLAAALTGAPDLVDGHRPGAIVCDLDRFKDVNDRLGHRVGDLALVEVARRIEAAVRPQDLVCRFGGDEFVVLCTDLAGAAELDAIATGIGAAFHEPFTIDGHVVEVGITVGSALAEPGDVAEPDALLLRADRAMYATKFPGWGAS